MKEPVALAGLIALALLAAPVIKQIVDIIKAVDPDKRVPGPVWIVVSFLVGALSFWWLNVDVSSLPYRGPTWLAQLMVGMFSGAAASGYHEYVGAKKAERITQERAAGTRPSSS